MKTVWFKNVEDDAKEELKGAYVSSLIVRKRLEEILQSKIDEHFKAQFNRDNYSDSNWAYAQADSLGYTRALTEVISLITDKKQEVTEKRPVGRPRKDATKPSPIV